MTTRTKWAIIFTLIALPASVWYWNAIPRPYERPPDLTPAEQRDFDAKKPGIAWTAQIGTERACWRLKGMRDVCFRRTIKRG